MKSKYYSHRGFFDNNVVYENTLEAFEISIAKGYGIELDVRMTKDNKLIVFHDQDLKRMLDHDTKIQDLTLVELNKLSTKFHIPTLKEVLDLIDGQVDLIVEIKHGKDNKILCKLVKDILLTYKGLFSVESFHPYIVYWFKKNAPGIERGQLLMSVKEYDLMVLGMFMITHITSLFTRPDFYAYRKELGSSKFARWLLNGKHKYIVVWTLMEGDPLYLNAQKIIFENCDNPEILWPLPKKLQTLYTCK